jgi:hypothetical protein
MKPGFDRSSGDGSPSFHQIHATTFHFDGSGEVHSFVESGGASSRSGQSSMAVGEVVQGKYG